MQPADDDNVIGCSARCADAALEWKVKSKNAPPCVSYINFTGPVVFYVTGTGTSKHPANGFWTFNNHITTYQNAPANLVFEVTTNTSVQYDFDQPIYAAVYAPLSTVTTWGNADDYGSIVGNVLNMYTGWHVDEALSADGGGPYVPVQGSYIEVQ